MADINEFFTQTLPAKFENGAPGGGIFQFKLTGDEDSNWTVDLDSGKIENAEPEGEAGCVITCSQEDFSGVLDEPSSAMGLFMSGRLTASNLGMAMGLQSLLS